MTLAQVIARGDGEIEYAVTIAGSAYFVASCTDSISDSWATGLTRVGVLRRESVGLSARMRPGEVWPETRGCDLLIDDDGDETLSQYLRTQEALASTVLTTTLTPTATTVEVASTDGFAATGADADERVLYVDQETIKYTTRNAATFTGCTRGAYGSLATEHIVAPELEPPCEPEVFDGPGDLRGRRVVVYMAERHLDGTLGAFSQVWVGYVSSRVSYPAGQIRIPISHMICSANEN